MGQIRGAIGKLKKRKAAGHNRITGEMMKNLGEKGYQFLSKTFNTSWKEKWLIGILQSIYKKGDELRQLRMNQATNQRQLKGFLAETFGTPLLFLPEN